jgi:hypothetical protein
MKIKSEKFNKMNYQEQLHLIKFLRTFKEDLEIDSNTPSNVLIQYTHHNSFFIRINTTNCDCETEEETLEFLRVIAQYNIDESPIYMYNKIDYLNKNTIIKKSEYYKREFNKTVEEIERLYKQIEDGFLKKEDLNKKYMESIIKEGNKQPEPIQDCIYVMPGQIIKIIIPNKFLDIPPNILKEIIGDKDFWNENG